MGENAAEEKAEQERLAAENAAKEEAARKAEQERIAVEEKASEQNALSLPCPNCLPKSAAVEGTFGTGLDPNTRCQSCQGTRVRADPKGMKAAIISANIPGLPNVIATLIAEFANDLQCDACLGSGHGKCVICCGDGKVPPELVALTKCSDQDFCTGRRENRGDMCWSEDYDTAFEMMETVHHKTEHLKPKDKVTYTDDGTSWKFTEGGWNSITINHKLLGSEQKRLVKAYLDAHLLSRGITPPTEAALAASRARAKPVKQTYYRPARQPSSSYDSWSGGDRRRLTAIQASRGVPSKSSRRS